MTILSNRQTLGSIPINCTLLRHYRNCGMAGQIKIRLFKWGVENEPDQPLFPYECNIILVRVFQKVSYNAAAAAVSVSAICCFHQHYIILKNLLYIGHVFLLVAFNYTWFLYLCSCHIYRMYRRHSYATYM